VATKGGATAATLHLLELRAKHRIVIRAHRIVLRGRWYCYHFWIHERTLAPKDDILYRRQKLRGGSPDNHHVAQLRRSAKTHSDLVAQMFDAIGQFNLPYRRREQIEAAAATEAAARSTLELKLRIESEAVAIHAETGRAPVQLKQQAEDLERMLRAVAQVLSVAAAAERCLDAKTVCDVHDQVLRVLGDPAPSLNVFAGLAGGEAT